jgi:flagellum-specific peptidoglycan hydrolase FlgJ
MFYRSVCNLQVNENNRETQGRTNFKKSKSKMKMNIFKIKTSAWEEESFILATQLSEKQIRSVIQPMVDEERYGDFVFSNDDYVQVLKDAYPKSVILTDNGDTQEIVF